MTVRLGWTLSDRSRGAIRWLGPVLGLFSLGVMIFALEVGARIAFPVDSRLGLPRFGLSEAEQRRQAWIKRLNHPGKTDTTSYPTSFDLPDPELGWRVKPNVDVRHQKKGVYDVIVHTNNRSMRGAEPVSLTKSSDTVRVGVFGCSQTFGETVNDDEVYVSRLNQGVRGYGTDQMVLYYEDVGNLYDLDVVVLAFAIYHIRRNASSFLYYAKPYFKLTDGNALVLHGTPVPAPDAFKARALEDETRSVADRSVLLRWGWQRFRNWRERSLYRQRSEAWVLTEALIERFVTDARRDGSIVVLMQIDENHPRLEKPLAALAQRLGVVSIDLGPVLRAADAAGIEYALPSDYHWNAIGHEIVARELRDRLCRDRVVRCK